MSTDNKEIARRLMEEVWNNRQLDVVDEIIDASYGYHDPNSPDFGQGPESYRARVTFYTTAFPDLRFVIEDMIAEEDRVLVRWEASGTHRGELLGVSATGKAITGTGMHVMQCRNGKVVHEWGVWDALGLLRQLGALPTPAAGRAA
jgi:steroid delta-isomerase-like uncharacterized protein